MAESKKQVLVVTDYSGQLHITPFNNKGFYLQRNQMMAKAGKQYKLQEMEEDAADKYHKDNHGIDPSFVAPADVQEQIGLRDAEIEKLRKQLEELQSPTTKTVVQQIQSAQTPEEVNQIASQYDDKAIAAAAAKKIKELTK